jgi:transglutaminase-like putative cysteine protease
VLELLPFLAAAGLYGAVTGAWWVASALAASSIASLWRWPGVPISPLVASVIAGGASALSAIFFPLSWLQASLELSELTARAAFGLLTFAILRAHLNQPLFGKGFGFALLFAVMVACGQAQGGWAYPVWVVVVLVAMGVSLLQDKESGPGWSHVQARGRARIALGLLVGAGMTVAATVSLPLLHARVIRVFYDWERRGSTTGVGDDIVLGGAADISESMELVLRVHGPHGEHFRGVVFNRYRKGRWVPGQADPGKPLLLSNQPPLQATRVEAVKSGPRFFVPLQASAVASPSGIVLIDRMGTLRAPAGVAAETIWFSQGESPEQPIQPPEPDDLDVPEDVREKIRPLASSWTQDASDDASRLRALEGQLQQGFEYSLRHQRKTNADPIVDFLLLHRTGHCEYFASGMVILARSLGIPARVASGFRVHERNPVGGFYAVRARDAHAWVEAWVDGSWRTYDPTPPGALGAQASGTTPWARAWWDWSQDRWSRVDGAQIRLWLFVSVAVLAGSAAFLLWLRRWLRDRRGKGAGEQAGPLVPSMRELLAALGGRGWDRPPSETLESYARRLRGEPGEALARAAEILEQYAGFLYGGVGSANELESATVAWLSRFRRAVLSRNAAQGGASPRQTSVR